MTTMAMRRFPLQNGFTLLETIMTLAAIAIVAGLSMPLVIGLQNRNELDIATQVLVSSLRRAQVLSMAMDGDSSWGVKIVQGSATVFRGASYASRTATYDEPYAMSAAVTVSGTDEVVFSKLTGEPAASAITNLTVSGQTWVVEVNTKGRIEYYPYDVGFAVLSEGEEGK